MLNNRPKQARPGLACPVFNTLLMRPNLSEHFNHKGEYKMKVRNMTGRSGQPVKNQFILEDGQAEIFQSYSSVIAMKSGGRVYLDKNKWDYSTTTGKYRNQFLGMNKAQTEQAIKNGDIILTNLN